MPLSPYLLAAGVRAFGASPLYLLLVNWIPGVAAGFWIVRCGRALFTVLERFTLVAVVLSVSLLVPGDGHLVFPYYPGVVHALLLSIGALWLLRSESESSASRDVLSGFLAGLAFCCKQEVGLAALLALCTAAVARPKPRVPRYARLAGGFIAGLAPAAVFVLTSAPLVSLQKNCHLWPLDLSPPASARYLMRVAMGIHYPSWPTALRQAAFGVLWRIVLLALVALLLARERRRSLWLRVGLLLAALAAWCVVEGFSPLRVLSPISLSMSIAFLVAILAFYSRQLPARHFLIAMSTFAGLVGVRTAFSSTVAGHYDGPGHLASGFTWLAFLCLFVPRLLLKEGRSAAYLRRLAALVVLCLSAWSTWGGIENLRYQDRVRVSTREGDVFVKKENAAVFSAIARGSEPGERALILPQTNAVDVLFHLKSASPVIDPLPPWLDMGVEKEVLGRLAKSPPALVIVFERPVREYGSAPFGKGYGLQLAEWLSRHYEAVDSFSAGVILRLRAAPPLPRAE
jgi:hypothetical protein